MAQLITVKDAVSQASMEIGISQVPINQAIGSQDEDIAQMVALLSAVADEVLDEQPYADTLGDGNWILVAKDGSSAAKPTADEDQIMFDGRLAIAGLKMRFLAVKGLEFGEQMRDFTVRLNKLGAKANARVLDLYSETDGGRMQ
jgi:hypothetical protein